MKEPDFDPIVLPQSLPNLKTFCDNSPVGISFLDRQGKIIYANKTELELLGYESNDYFGSNISAYHEEKPSLNYVMSSLTSGSDFKNVEASLICKDGTSREVLLSSIATHAGSRSDLRVCFTRDITYLKKSERYLKILNKASEELSSLHDTHAALNKITEILVPNIADWVVINELGPDGKAHLLKMAHADPEKVKWAERYRRDHPVNMDNPQQGSVGWTMRTGQAFLVPEVTREMIENGASDAEQLEVLLRLNIQSVMVVPMQIKGRINGAISFMSCNAAVRYGEQEFSFAKDLANHIAVTLENTRLYDDVKANMKERLRIDRKKDEFISIASHELKTPITVLKAYTQVLQQEFENERDARRANMVGNLNKQVDKLHNLVVDLLDMTKLDQDELVFHFEEMDFNKLVADTVGEMQQTTRSHEIIMDLKPCESIRADQNRLGQVIVNFLSNAIKYSPKSDKVIVATDCTDHKVILTVTDFGIGIPDTEHTNLFKRFFRGLSQDSDSFPGLGLGLYISAEIIKKHHGSISFSSKVGKGSVFQFEIPAITTGDQH